MGKRIVVICGLLLIGSVFSVGIASAQLPNMNLSATNILQATLKLSWLDWWFYETSYRVERIVSGDSWGSAVTTTLGVDTTSYTATGLLGGTTYVFRVLPYSGTVLLSATGNYLTVTTASGATPTPGPTPTATPVPLPAREMTRTTANACTVTDGQFTLGTQQAWTVSGNVAWTPGRIRLQPDASIQQIVSVGGTHTYSTSIIVGATTTSTVKITAGTNTNTFTVTSLVPTTHRFSHSIIWPSLVRVENLSGGEVTLVSVCLIDQAGLIQPQTDVTIFSDHDPIIAVPLNLGDFTQYFQPIPLSHMFDFSLEGDWESFFELAGSVFATFTKMTSVNVIQFYVGFRITLLGLTWLIGFVLKEIGLKLPEEEKGQSVVDRPWRRGRTIPRLPRYRIPKRL